MAARKNTIVSHFQLFLENMKLSIMSAMEYRTNFIMQTVGMFVNDIFWISLWWLLFTRFGDINGWVFKDILILYSLLTVSFGLVGSIFYGARKMYKTVAEGRLDYYLVLPKNVFFYASLKTGYAAVGDVLFGLVLIPFCLTLGQMPLYIYFAITGAILVLSIATIFNSLAFYLGNAEKARQTGEESFLTFASYPLSAFGGGTKLFLLTIFPSALIGGVPVETFKQFSWFWVIFVGVVALIFLAIALTAFYTGLKRYESGNYMYAKD